VRCAGAVSDEAILYIHGGGYMMGSAQAYRGLVSQLVSRAKIPAFAIDYPLAPEAPFPQAPQAVLKAWNFLVGEGFKRIAIVGDSAGGGLAAGLLSELARAPGGIKPFAGVLLSPWVDLAFKGASMGDEDIVDPMLAVEFLHDCASKYLAGTDAANPQASPLYCDLRGLPPLLVQVGTDERLLDDARRLVERAFEAGVQTQLEIWEGMHHVFHLGIGTIESSAVALDRVAVFLQASA
jgi:acetyl esterase/lipase